MRRIEFLGFEIIDGEIRPNKNKIQALIDSPVPDSVHRTRQFVGLATYLQKFIPKCSQVLSPLYRLTSKNSKFLWSEE